MEAKNTNQIVIYQSSENIFELKIKFDGESVWANLNQISHLFNKDKSVISRHIKNIYDSGELDYSSTVAKNATVQKEGSRNISRTIEYYNLDAILSVGYRVNSKQATQFRIWATSILKKYLVQGYLINEKRLQEVSDKFIQLQDTVQFLAQKSQAQNLKGQESEIITLLNSYSKSLTFLEQFDKNNFPDLKGRKAHFKLDYQLTQSIIQEIKKELILKQEATDLFGSERGSSFAAILGNLYQSFDNQDLYPSIEMKAAHLLYFVIKDHPFSDGNKRNASFLFVYFLSKNNYLYKKTGEHKINDNALTALALLVAESDPKEKDIIIRLIMNLISEG